MQIVFSEEEKKEIMEFAELVDPCDKKGCSAIIRMSCCGCPEVKEYENKRVKLRKAGLLDAAAELSCYYKRQRECKTLQEELTEAIKQTNLLAEMLHDKYGFELEEANQDQDDSEVEYYSPVNSGKTSLLLDTAIKIMVNRKESNCERRESESAETCTCGNKPTIVIDETSCYLECDGCGKRSEAVQFIGALSMAQMALFENQAVKLWDDMISKELDI